MSDIQMIQSWPCSPSNIVFNPLHKVLKDPRKREISIYYIFSTRVYMPNLEQGRAIATTTYISIANHLRNDPKLDEFPVQLNLQPSTFGVYGFIETVHNH